MRTWDGTADAYRRSFATLCAKTIPALLEATEGVEPCAHLDVGCGTGELAAAAEALGRSVVAVDADASMVAAAVEVLQDGRVVDGRVVNGRVLRAALPQLPLEDASADVITANFVINHIEQPQAGVTELVRILRPGGLLAMTIWPPGGTGWAPLIGGIFREAGAVDPPSTRLPEHLDFPRTPDGLAGLAGTAGLRVQRQEELLLEWEIRPDDLWEGIRGGVATPGATYLAQSAEVRDRIRETFVRRMPDPLRVQNRAVLVVARKP